MLVPVDWEVYTGCAKDRIADEFLGATYVHPGTLFEGEEVEKGGDMMQSVMMVEFG